LLAVPPVEGGWRAALAASPPASAWLEVQADLGLAPRTVEAYGRALADYLAVCVRDGIDPCRAGRADIARYVRDLMARPHPRGGGLVGISSGAGLANATLQQRLVAVRLFYDYLVEESICPTNTRGQLVEAKEDMERMLTTIPLTEQERAAAEGDKAAVEGLLQRLADVPTPAGPTPRGLGFTPLRVVPGLGARGEPRTPAEQPERTAPKG